jgi:ComF family protein
MAAAPYAYESGAAVIVRSLKYGRWRSVVPAMVEDMSACGDAAVRALGVRPPAVVIPVPLSGARLRERGFNQAEELARRVAASLDHPLEPLLGREGGGRRQAGAGVDRRRQNVQGSFFMARRPEPGVRSALLVDDVLTTGATILACVDVLREAGFRRVAALTFARTLRAHQAPDHG